MIEQQATIERASGVEAQHEQPPPITPRGPFGMMFVRSEIHERIVRRGGRALALSAEISARTVRLPWFIPAGGEPELAAAIFCHVSTVRRALKAVVEEGGVVVGKLGIADGNLNCYLDISRWLGDYSTQERRRMLPLMPRQMREATIAAGLAPPSVDRTDEINVDRTDAISSRAGDTSSDLRRDRRGRTDRSSDRSALTRDDDPDVRSRDSEEVDLSERQPQPEQGRFPEVGSAPAAEPAVTPEPPEPSEPPGEPEAGRAPVEDYPEPPAAERGVEETMPPPPDGEVSWPLLVVDAVEVLHAETVIPVTAEHCAGLSRLDAIDRIYFGAPDRPADRAISVMIDRVCEHEGRTPRYLTRAIEAAMAELQRRHEQEKASRAALDEQPHEVGRQRGGVLTGEQIRARLNPRREQGDSTNRPRR